MQRRLSLTGEKQFSSIHREGRSWANRHLVLKALPNGLEDSRFGFSTSRRVGNAVIRNRVKRRLREVIRSTHLKPGWDVLVMGRTAAGTADFHQLREALQNLLQRANLLSPAPMKGTGNEPQTNPRPRDAQPLNESQGPRDGSERC